MTTHSYEIVVLGGGPAANAFINTLFNSKSIYSKKIVQIYPNSLYKDGTGLLTDDAIKWFKTFGLEKKLSEVLDKPEISDLIYVVREENGEYIELGRRKNYLVNANREKLDLLLRNISKSYNINTIDAYVVDIFPTTKGFSILLDNGDIIFGETIIDGTGAYSVVPRSFGVVKPAIKGFGVQWYFKVKENKHGEIPKENIFVYDKLGEVPYVIWITPKNDEIIIGGPVPPKDSLLKIIDISLDVLNEYGYNIKREDLILRAKKYSTSNVPISEESFIYTLPNRTNSDSIVFVTGESGRFVTPRNVNGIPYALWTGTFAAEFVDAPEKYKEKVYDTLVKPKLLKKIEQAKQIYGENIKLFIWP